jgi:nitrogen fixation NifU-like protein
VGEYSARVVDHFTEPRNLGRLPDPDATAVAANACCGDRLHLDARVRDGRIAACSFLAYGCAPTIALGSLLTEALAGREIDGLAGLDEDWVAGLAGGLAPRHRHCADLGKDAVHALARSYRAARPKGSRR